jgi:protein-disulfide isomerase
MQKAFRSCIESEMSLGLVYRDMNLAATNQVTGTPTIFIKGRRIEGVRDTAQLQQLIEKAKAGKVLAEPTSVASGETTR